MELELHEINVTLSKDQKEKFVNAFITSRNKKQHYLKRLYLRGSDTLLVPTQLFQRDG